MCVYVCSQGLNPAIVARLPEWQFAVPLLFEAHLGLPISDQPTALRNALVQVNTPLDTPTPMVELGAHWHFTPELTNAISTALPARSDLRLRVSVGKELTDAAARQIWQIGPRLFSVYPDSFAGLVRLNAALQGDTAGAAGLAGLAGLPPLVGGGRRVILFFELLLDENDLKVS